MDRRARRRVIHAALVALGLVPALGLLVGAAGGRLGANPVETITHVTGEWALRSLLASLAVTPLVRWFGWSELRPLRRSLGLLAFGYASAHFATYLSLDLGFDFAFLAEDILERPYITVGFGTFLMLLPLAITSTRGWQRRLGRRWPRLHQLVYPAAIGAVVHFLWLVKADLREPLLYAALVAILLGTRLWWRLSSGRASASSGRSREASAPR